MRIPDAGRREAYEEGFAEGQAAASKATEHRNCPYDGGWCTRCGQPFEVSLVEVTEEPGTREVP